MTAFRTFPSSRREESECFLFDDPHATSSMLIGENGKSSKHPVGSAPGCIKGGNDLIMPGSSEDMEGILNAIGDDNSKYPISRGELLMTASRILNMIIKLA